MSTKTPAISEPLTPPRPFVAFGRVLTELRKEARLRKTDLARACEVSWQTVGRWENGRMLPTHDNRVRIANALHTVPRVAERLENAAAPYSRAQIVVAQTEGSPDNRATMGIPALNDALTKAFDPARHTMTDGAAVLAAFGRIRPGVIDRAEDPVARARALLDVAAELRLAHEPVTVEALAFLAGAPRARPKVTQLRTSK